MREMAHQEKVLQVQWQEKEAAALAD